MKKPAIRLFLASISLALVLSGCLKTRAQLREDEGTNESGAPVQQGQVQDVQPKGEYVIDEIKSEITRLEGRLEDVERSQTQLNSQKSSANDELMKKLEARLQDLETAQANLIEQVKKFQADAEASKVDPVELYEKGKKQYAARNYEGAIESLNSYLKSPKAKSVQEATYLRAESYYELKQYKKAIIDYSKFPEKFPHSKHVAAALYRIGQSFDAMGMRDDARSFYQELVDKFPKSPEAKRSRPKLK